MLAGRVIPGIDRVHAQTEPFAAAWRSANEAALASETGDPLWVALGDSMTQGIGAPTIRAGFVGQLQTRLARRGTPYRVANLSSTGARVEDVITEQLPALAGLPEQPALITLFIGANDMTRKARRATAVADFAALLTALPVGPQIVAAKLLRRNPESLGINALIDAADAAGQLRAATLADLSLRELWKTLADDYFHPNELGYTHLADAFYDALF